MLEFMNTPSCNHYYLVHRIKDCEKNLTAFNYATPMAICIEAMLKNILHLYDKSLDIQDIERRQKTLPCWSLRRHPVTPPLPIGESRVKKGDKVSTIGSPLGLINTVSGCDPLCGQL